MSAAQAKDLVRQTWRRSWLPELAALFGLFHGGKDWLGEGKI